MRVDINRYIQQQRVELERIAFDLGRGATLEDLRKAYKPTKEKPQSVGLAGKAREYAMTHSLRENAVKPYMALIKHLNEFSPGVEVHEAGKGFQEKFLAWMRSKGLTDNTTSKYIGKLQSVLRWDKEQGSQVPEDYGKLKRQHHDKEEIFLTREELEQLMNAEIPEHLEPYRDMFLFSCFSGLRHSDVMSFSRANIKGDFIRLNQIKTRSEAVIPLNSYLRSILDKYDRLPPKFSNQKVNAQLKVIGLLAGRFCEIQ